MKEILKVNNISKSFGKKKVLDNVSFSLEKGHILGLVGPNGAGKTTAIKLMLGLQSIDSGEVYFNGYSIEKDFEKAILKVGAIVENPDHYMYLTGYENLKLIKNLYSDITDEDIERVVKLVKLDNRIHDKVKKYSLGMRQRLGIARAILAKPNILILDEPTNGLDPEGIKELRELLKDLAERGMAILVSSHNLRELETFITDVCIIQNGKTKEIGTLKSFKKTDGVLVYTFEVNNTKEIERLIKEATIVDGDTFELSIKKEELNNVLSILIKNDIEIYSSSIKDKSLEDVFLKKTGGNQID